MGARKGDKPTLNMRHYYMNPLSCLFRLTPGFKTFPEDTEHAGLKKFFSPWLTR